MTEEEIGRSEIASTAGRCDEFLCRHDGALVHC